MKETLKELVGPQVDFRGIYRGVVVDTNDPEQQGRVRVKVFDVMDSLEGEDYKHIPWAVPAMPLSSGAWGSKDQEDGTGSFYVPRVDSNVFVFFEAGDFNQPVYFAEALDAARQPAFRLTHYPLVRGMVTPSGVSFIIDDHDVSAELSRPDGTLVKLHANGDAEVYSTHEVKIHAATRVLVFAPRVDVNINEIEE